MSFPFDPYGTWRLRLLLSQEKAKIRELGPDGPTPSLDDEILQPADDEIPFFSFFKTKNFNEDKCQGGKPEGCVQQKLGETTEFDSVFHEFSEFPLLLF